MFTADLLKFVGNYPTDGYRMIKESAKYIQKNPRRSYDEVSELAEFDIMEIMKELKEKGIKISVIAGADDLTFFMDKIQKKLGKAYEDGYLDGFCSVKGGHFDFIGQPEKYMQAIDSVLK